MGEVKIVLTYDEALWLMDAIWIKIEESSLSASRYLVKHEEVPGWLVDQIMDLTTIYNKIQKAIHEL